MTKKHIFLLIFLVLIGLISSVSIFGLDSINQSRAYLYDSTKAYYSFENNTINGNYLNSLTNTYNSTAYFVSNYNQTTGFYNSTHLLNYSSINLNSSSLWYPATVGFNMSLHLWLYSNNFSQESGVFMEQRDWTANSGFSMSLSSNVLTVYYLNGVGNIEYYFTKDLSSFNNGQWNRLFIFKPNNTLTTAATVCANNNCTQESMTSNSQTGTGYIIKSPTTSRGLMLDELIVFNNNLSSNDLSYLYNSTYSNTRQYPYPSENGDLVGTYYFTSKNIITNSALSSFTITAYDLNTYTNTSISTTTGSTSIDILRNHNYTFTIDSSGYVLTSVNLTPTLGNQSYQFSIYPENSIRFNVYDAATGVLFNSTKIAQVTMVSSSTQYTIYTVNGTNFTSNIVPDYYTVTINSSGYYPTSYTVTITNRTTQTLNAYLISNTTSLFFQFYIKDLGNHPLENAVVNIQQLVNGTYVQIGNKNTDITGFTYFYLLQETPYKFTITADGFNTKTFIMNVFTINSPYTIKLDPTAASVFNDLFSEVTFSILPTNSTLSSLTNNFSLQTSSPNGKLLYTYINCSGIGQNISGSPNGATVYGSFTSNYGDVINCIYMISVDGFEPYIYYKTYYIGKQNLIPTNTSLQESMDDFITDTGKGWTTILAMLIILGVAATLFSLTGNTLISTFTVFGGIAFFAAVGWIPLMIAFFSCTIAALYYFLTARGG